MLSSIRLAKHEAHLLRQVQGGFVTSGQLSLFQSALSLRAGRWHKRATSSQERSMLTLAQAQAILSAALSHADKIGFKPLAIAILDARGAQKAFAAQDGTSLKRGEIALGKAHGAVAMGIGSRALHKMALERPYFVEAATHAVGGSLVPVPGGVLIRDAAGALIGAIGVSGDTSDNDEAAAVAGIAAAGLTSDTGA
jgi:uncharacterized protein GlcG (DUF336 family)